MNNGADLLEINECIPKAIQTEPERKQKCQAKIDQTLKNFDFARVHVVMTYLNWKWVGEGIPSIECLKKKAEKLLISLADMPRPTTWSGYRTESENWSIETSTGGLVAKRFGGKDPAGKWENFELLFTIATWTTDEV